MLSNEHVFSSRRNYKPFNRNQTIKETIMNALALRLGYQIGYALRRSYQISSMLRSYGIKAEDYRERIAELVAEGYTNEEIVTCIVIARSF